MEITLTQVQLPPSPPTYLVISLSVSSVTCRMGEVRWGVQEAVLQTMKPSINLRYCATDFPPHLPANHYSMQSPVQAPLTCWCSSYVCIWSFSNFKTISWACFMLDCMNEEVQDHVNEEVNEWSPRLASPPRSGHWLWWLWPLTCALWVTSITSSNLCVTALERDFRDPDLYKMAMNLGFSHRDQTP